MDFRSLIGNKFILFDGAMGTMIQRAGLKPGEAPEAYNIVHPEIIGEIHKQYIEAGAHVVTTNTFGANELKLMNTGYSVEEVVGQAVRIARSAAKDRFVALDIGPTGKLMEPAGDLGFEEAYDIFARQVRAGADGADLILIETISDLYEARAAVLAAKENSSLPVFCTMTFQENGRTLMGTDPATMVNVLGGLGVDALGINCSLGPDEIIPILGEILRHSPVPVMVQPNAGLPRVVGEETVYDISAEEFSEKIRFMAEEGALILGGCCGTTPEYIRAVRDKLEGIIPQKIHVKRVTSVCSSTRTVILGEGVRIIGERINPTGKKKFKEALKREDMDYIVSEAISQRDAGADILDVNVGLPEIDEKDIMVRAVKEIQTMVKLPLQIDSARADVIEAAVRVYNGKPIINSVNGKAEVMKQIFPIVKKYGACVVGLTLDENGIPSTAEERIEIAGKIIETAEIYGIPRENVLIDCLVLTASAQQQEVMETIKAVTIVKERYKTPTLLGVSNVSFGLPGRENLNRTYLAMALAAGLDTPIVNPMAVGIMETIRAFKVLVGEDREARDYIKAFGTKDSNNASATADTGRDLKRIVIDGIRDEAALRTEELLNVESPMEIVDEYLIPALEIVGQRYEKGDIFLPQLIQSAETVKGAFDVIKAELEKRGQNKVLKGKVLLATVRGDIHDIGKNIAKVLLENYGFDVYDLGKDVPPGRIMETALQEDIKLVGLSALMTTTVRSMEETIKALREMIPECRVMVGGAVMTEEYAAMIGADYHAKDARDGVRIANEVFNVK